jgi:5-methylcytosine-specific restriction protein B
MPIDPKAAEQLWDSFIARWDIDKLKSMTLEQYTQVGNDDSFTYWLEGRTESLGSIWGGSAFKFGIYHRDNHDPKPSERGRIFGENYAWYEKYGQTAEEAFEKVRSIVVSIAEASREGRFNDIEAIDLGQAVKWKIAFLYQVKDKPALLPIFKLEILKALTGTKKGSYPDISATLLSQQGDSPFFSHAAKLWDQGKALLEQKLSPDGALEYLQERFTAIKEPVQYMAGFVTDTGRQIGLVRRGSDVHMFVEPGNWVAQVAGLSLKKRYAATDERISSLGANAPNLTVGHPADKISVPTLAVLTAFCDAYDNTSSSLSEGIAAAATPSTSHISSVPTAMNKILYGPPGTGKTFKTAELAVEICDGDADMPREKLMARYEELRKEGRISFVTFHQSYGYEDFVEGLRPESKDGQVTYHVRRGIFREACDAARLRKLVKPGLTGKPLKSRTIYKMSLGPVGTQVGKQALQDCLENGYVVLGWGEDIDFTECKSADDVREKIKEERPSIENPESHARYLTLFKDDVKTGDIVVVSQGNTAYRAIGEISDEYQFQDPPVAGSYHQLRKVRWLAVFEGNREVSEIYDRNFAMSALYTLDSAGLNFDAIDSLIKGDAPGAPLNHVLIIDEINRANISKVFGELITLLEPDKREGQINEITLKLPYSGDSFSVPSNLFVVGTMNTADRSIALLDTALRRRFDFEELQPDYSAIPEEPIAGVDLRAMLRAINERIEYLYDRDHTLGHAYLLGISTLADLDKVFRRKVIPLLQEYFYEDWSKIRLVLHDQTGSFITADETIPNGLGAALDGIDIRTRYRVKDEPFTQDAYLGIYQ